MKMSHSHILSTVSFTGQIRHHRSVHDGLQRNPEHDSSARDLRGPELQARKASDGTGQS